MLIKRIIKSWLMCANWKTHHDFVSSLELTWKLTWKTLKQTDIQHLKYEVQSSYEDI